MNTALNPLKTLAAGLCLAMASAACLAQAYPARPITWLVGYPPGGAGDFLARTLSVRMAGRLGQSIVIENKAGAAGMIAATAGARAAPNGYTVSGIGNGEMVLNPLLYKKMNYAPRKDFAAVGTVAKIPFMLAVHSSLGVRDVPGLVALAKSRPGELDYASASIGHPNHLAMELFSRHFGIKMNHVPYGGMAPALQNFLSGAIQVMFIDQATALAQMQSGRFRVLAVSTKERLEALPGIPTLSELGAKDYDVFAWQALVVPAATPPDVVRTLSRALDDALQDPETVRKMKDAGMQPIAGDARTLDALIREDHARWAPLVESLKLQLD